MARTKQSAREQHGLNGKAAKKTAPASGGVKKPKKQKR
jgi:hypothetical protein